MNFLSFTQKLWRYLSLVLAVPLNVSLFFFPNAAFWLSIVLFFTSLGATAFLIIQKTQLSYRQGQGMRIKFGTGRTGSATTCRA
jgi:hypothetical protein